MTFSLQLKNGIYQTVISYQDEHGKRKYKWISTGLKEKGNKKRAMAISEQVFADFKLTHTEYKNTDETSSAVLFSKHLSDWLETIHPNIQETTYQGYLRIVKVVSAHFDSKQIMLHTLKPFHIQSYYNELMKNGLSANSVLHYHAVIRKSLQYAVKMDMIISNPADKIERPKKAKYKASFYNNEELQEMFKAFENDPYELLVYMIAYYGFRRSEALGLRWDAIDFVNKTIIVKHKLVEVNINGEHRLIPTDQLKNESSNRTLPLIPQVEERLLKHKAEQERNKALCGSAYDYEYEDYVFCNSLGNIITPDQITCRFPKVLKNNGLRHIRLHDLRHSCASLLLANGVPMKEIQLWLGHSNFSTTADIYSHLDYSSKIAAADVIANALNTKKE